MIVGATAMDPRQFHAITGGTINVVEIKACGARPTDGAVEGQGGPTA
jgi:hypothetical protein